MASVSYAASDVASGPSVGVARQLPLVADVAEKLLSGIEGFACCGCEVEYFGVVMMPDFAYGICAAVAVGAGFDVCCQLGPGFFVENARNERAEVFGAIGA